MKLKLECVIFIVSCLTSPFAAGQSTEDQLYPLVVRVRTGDNGGEWQGSNTNRIEATLWKKIEPAEAEHNDKPLVYVADGSLWQQVHTVECYGQQQSPFPYPHRFGVIEAQLSPGVYRVSAVNSKIYREWEGLPGTSEGGSSAQQQNGYLEVSGFGGPQMVYGWVLGDPIVIGGTKEKYEQALIASGVPATFTVTAPPEDAKALKVRFLREDGFPMERGRYGQDYGLPSKTTFQQIPPGKYKLCVFRGEMKGNALPSGYDVFPVEITESGPNDFTFAAEKSLTKQAPWQVHGTVRDVDGKPLSGVWVSLNDVGFSREQRYGGGAVFSTQTDDEGNYNLPITPFQIFSGTALDATHRLPVYGFRFQQFALVPHRNFAFEAGFKEKSRTTSGDLIVIGDFARPEDVAELTQRFAEEQYDVVFVEKNSPCRMDFVMEPQSIGFSQWPWNPYWDVVEYDLSDYVPPSWGGCLNFWVGKAESDRRYEMYRKYILPYTMNTVYKETLELWDKVSVSLRFPKSEIMLGEPTHFEYVVHNHSAVDLSVDSGGDYRGSRRPTSFTVRAVRIDGDTETTIYETPGTGDMGGMVGPHKMTADGGEYAFDLCLPCWLDLNEPGEYRIDVARSLNLSQAMEMWRPMASSTVLRVASGTLTVKPVDEDAFGKMIDAWGGQALVKDESSYQKFDRLEHIKDKRVIPWLLKLKEGDDNYYALEALTKFDDDAALERIARDIDSPEENKSFSSARLLAKSKHPEAINILLKHQDHENHLVRQMIVLAAAKMERETALQLLRKYRDDPNEYVSGPAKQVYEKLAADDSGENETR